jgi:3-methyladenine DNA glycosylase/8-oxoguanine DNA glycosylase
MPPAAEAQVAHAHLLGLADPIAALAARQGPVDPYVWPGIPVATGDRLGGLALHIAAQQISTVAALAIFGRFLTLLGGRLRADVLAAQPDEALRAVGLSGAKARALRELGEAVVSGAFDPDGLDGLGDDEAEARLVALRGVGPWSAQMFLLHELRRPDVFPAGDVALRTALGRLDGAAAAPTVREAGARALAWRPYRSYAAAHLWRSLRPEAIP